MIYPHNRNVADANLFVRTAILLRYYFTGGGVGAGVVVEPTGSRNIELI